MPNLPILAAPPVLHHYAESQLAFLTEWSAKLCDAVHQVSALNLHLCQHLLEDQLALNRTLLASRDLAACSAAAMSAAQPMAERLRHYQQQMLNVLTSAQVDLGRSANSHLPEAGRNGLALADELLRKANQETERVGQRQLGTLDNLTPRPAQPLPNGVH